MKVYIKKKLDFFIKNSYWYNEVAFKDCRKFWELNEKEIEVVNLGSSSGTYDFDYTGIPIKGANWAVAPQSMVGDFAILKQYESRLKKGATIIYPLCPFTSISGAEEYVEDRCYTFLKYDLIPNAHYIRLTKTMQMKETPLLYYPLVRLKQDLKKILRHKGEPIRTMNDQQLKENACGFMNSWKKQFGLVDLSLPFSGHNKMIYDKGVKLLQDMVTFCREKGLRLVIVIPPMHNTLASHFSVSDRQNLIESFIHSGIDSSIEYYNMMDDNHFSEDSSLFINSYYLNKRGAMEYTKYLLKKIQLL